MKTQTAKRLLSTLNILGCIALGWAISTLITFLVLSPAERQGLHGPHLEWGPSAPPVATNTTPEDRGVGGGLPAVAGGQDLGACGGATQGGVLDEAEERRVSNAGRRRGYQEGVRAGWERGYRQAREDWGHR